MAARLILLALVVLVFVGNARADDINLYGSTTKEEDAVANSDTVFSARVTSIGGPHSKGTGPTYYPVVLDVGESYLGSVVSNPICWTRISDTGEVLPSVGNTYLFFVKKNEGRELVPQKILPATDDNIAVAKKLISQAILNSRLREIEKSMSPTWRPAPDSN